MSSPYSPSTEQGTPRMRPSRVLQKLRAGQVVGDGRRAVLEAHGPQASLWLERTVATSYRSGMS